MTLSLGFGLGLSRMGLSLGGGGWPPVAPADYTITNDAQWATVFANSDATLSGKIIDIAGPLSARTLSVRNFPVAPVIRGAGGEIPSIIIDRIANLTFSGVTFQHRSWPASATIVNFGTAGLSSNITFSGGMIRHGYGPTQADIDTDRDYPEYTRVNNVGTATTTSSRIALTWQDPAAVSARIYVFNRGAATIYANAGNSSVVATTGNTAILPGAVLPVTVNPTTTSHIAVISESGSVEYNARTEIGLAYYLANAFSVGGGSAGVQNLVLRGVHFEGLANVIKGGSIHDGQHIIMDCTGRANYMDLLAMGTPTTANSTTWFLRNLFQRPFAKSGIAENLDGDANDPHGDLFQKFGTTNATHQVFSAGNTFWTGDIRPDGDTQGHFYQQAVTHNSVIVGDIMTVGAPRGMSIQTAESTMVHGFTVIDPQNPQLAKASVFFGNVSGSNNAISSVVAKTLTIGANVSNFGTYTLPDDPSALFADYGSRFTARTRAEVEAALRTVGAAAGLGAVAVRDAGAIDWTTTDHTAVIRWENIPSMVDFPNLTEQDLAATATTALSRVLNRRAAQTVVPGAGVQWRSVAVDGTTEVQAWTSASGTIEPLQYIQIRGTTAATEETTTQLSVTINGFAVSVDVTTRIVGSAYFVGQTVATYDGETGQRTISLTGLTNGLATAPAEGDLVVVSIANAASADRRTSMSVDTAGYVGVAELFANSTRDTNFGVYYKVMGATPDTSVLASVGSGSADPKIVTVQVFRGFDAVTPFDVAATTATAVNTTKPDPAAITPTTSGALIVVAAAAATGTGTTPAESATIGAAYLGDVSTTAKIHPSQPRAVSSIMGSVEWTGGTYNPAAMTCAAADTGNSVASVTMALRPA